MLLVSLIADVVECDGCNTCAFTNFILHYKHINLLNGRVAWLHVHVCTSVTIYHAGPGPVAILQAVLCETVAYSVQFIITPRVYT